MSILTPKIWIVTLIVIDLYLTMIATGARLGVFAEHVTYKNSMFEFDLFNSTLPFGVCICICVGFWYLG